MTSVRTTIVERFPVFYSQVGHEAHRRADDPDPVGPFYAPGSSWYVPFTVRNLAWKLSSAESLRRDGYTVTVDVVDSDNPKRFPCAGCVSPTDCGSWAVCELTGDDWTTTDGEGR